VERGFRRRLRGGVGQAAGDAAPPEHDHALEEVDRAALAVAREPEQVVDLLRYFIEGTLPPG
jgi:hypothetical protein